MTSFRWILPGLILLVTACQDPGLLFPGLGDDASRTIVGGAVNGGLYQSGETLAITIAKPSDPSQQPDAATIRLLVGDQSPNPLPLLEKKLGAEQIGPGRVNSISLPELKPGPYRLIALLFRSGVQIRKESLVIFIGYTQPEFQGIVAHPTILVPKDDGVLELAMDPLKFPNAYIRWTAGQETLKTGLVKAGGLSLAIKAPAYEGVYTYRAEIFPCAPLSGDYDFKSPQLAEYQVIVSQKGQGMASDFGPDTEFSHLWHFKGNLADSGRNRTQAAQTSFAMVGDTQFERHNDVLGYALGQSNLARLPLSLVTELNQDGPALAIHCRILPLQIRGGLLFKTGSVGGDSGLQCEMTGEGQLQWRIWGSGYDQSLVTESPLLTNNPTHLAVYASRNHGVLYLLIMADTQILLNTTIAIKQSALAPLESVSGQTELGSLGGPRFIIDELGLYQPQKPINDPFKLSMEYQFGKGLQFARSFISSPSLEGLVVQGGASVISGGLALSPGASVSLPTISLGNHRTIIEIDFADKAIGGESRLIIEGPSLRPVVLDFGGIIAQGNRNLAFTNKLARPWRLSLEARTGGFELAWADHRFLAIADKIDALSLRLAQTDGAKSNLEIKSLAVAELPLPEKSIGP